MTIDPLWLWVGAAVVGAIVLVSFLTSALRRSRSARLREKFGAEYDFAVRRAGSRSDAERLLRERAEEAEKLTIRTLTAEERKSYRDDWARIEARFVDRPTTAVAEADELIGNILRQQGYSINFDTRLAHFSARNPLLAQHYRSGHEISGRGGEATTEDLRQAMLHYRAVFDSLIGTRDDIAQPMPVEVESGRPARSDRASRPIANQSESAPPPPQARE
jgi:hypothetical protein